MRLRRFECIAPIARPVCLGLLCISLLAVIANNAAGHGAYHERISELTAALAKDPENPGLRLQLATVYCQHRDWQQALLELDAVDHAAPNGPSTDLLRGEALLGAGRAAEARQTLDRFISTQPENYRAFLIRARAQQTLGELDAALNDYRSAMKPALTPDRDSVQEAADALSAAGHTDDAISILIRAIERHGPAPSLVTRLIDLESATGCYDSALARIASMEQTAPRPEPWMAKRAMLLERAGRLEDARTAWENLKARLVSLPNLERGTVPLRRLEAQADQALRSLASRVPTIPPQTAMLRPNEISASRISNP